MGLGTIYITTNQQWTITGPAWIPALPISGAGNYEYSPVTSANPTSTYRTSNIVITYQDGSIDTIPVVQFQSTFVNAKIYVLGLDDDEGQYVKYNISLADGRTMTDANTACGESLDISNYPQAGIIPVNGDTVSMIIYTNDDYKTWSANLGNKAYWLASATQYDTGEDVIANGATQILLSSASPNYTGNFVYTQNNFFYIVLDYRNIIDCSSATIVADIDGSFYPLNIDISYTDTTAGLAELGYTLINPYDISADYNDALIMQDEASASGSVTFDKSDVDEEYVRMVISNGDSPIVGDVTITMVCPSLTSFSLGTNAYDTVALGCAGGGGTTTRYHNGVNALPDVGDIIYTNSTGVTIFDGNDKYYRVGTDVYGIDTNGYVTSITSCICTEVAIPVVTPPGDIYVQVGIPLAFKLSATLNPTSWAFSSSYYEYVVSGNSEGGTFSYTDINGCTVNSSVNIGEEVTIIGNTVVVSSFGDASVSSAGAMYYPKNIYIDANGQIGGVFNVSGTYTYNVIATNCFGNSVVEPITFIVKHQATLAPFNMVSVGECDSVTACASTEPYQVFWFDNNPCEGTCVYPEINDFVYIDGYGEQYLNGGYLYYQMDNGEWLLIDGIGQVVNKGTC